jgi:hypothetical protein
MKILLVFALSAAALYAQQTPAVPDWAQPGSPTHKQVPPPKDFHRPSRTSNTPIGIFEGQSDIGGAVVPGSSSYDAATKQYTIRSAGYNIWYSRDEFRFLWKKMAGDVSLAADVTFPDPKGYNDRKAVLVLRQTLDDDSKEIMTGEHGTGMVHLAGRPEQGAGFRDYEYRLSSVGQPSSPNPGARVDILPKRIGIERHGDEVALYISLEGEPLHQFGPPMHMHFEGPVYVGIGFTSHLPATPDTAILSNVVLENSAEKVR